MVQIEDLDRYAIGRLLTPAQQAMYFRLGNEIDTRRRVQYGFAPQDEQSFRRAFVVGEQVGWTSLRVCRALLTAASAW